VAYLARRGDPRIVRRLVLAADLSLDGYLGADGVDPGWTREYDDEHLASYQDRVLRKAGVLAPEETCSVDDVTALRSEGGDEELAPILAQGGTGFYRELIRRGLVDEYRIVVYPVVFGEGHRLFSTHQRLLQLNVRFFANGVMACTYVPVERYQDHPPPYPWTSAGSSAGSEGPDEHDDDPES
jgi:hypothetical protein